MNTHTPIYCKALYSKVLYTLVILLTTHYTSLAQLKVLSNGKVGVRNSSPTYDLDVNATGVRFQNWTSVLLDWSGFCGSPVLYPTTPWYLQLGKQNQRIGNIFTDGIHSPSYWTDSDDSIKTNVSAIANALELVQQLNGKAYYFRDGFTVGIPDSLGMKDDFKRKHYGFMARELITVIPEIVKHDSLSDRYFVDYLEVIPFLTEAIKAQQNIIQTLNNKVNNQEGNINHLQNELNLVKNQMIAMQASIQSLNDAIINCCNGNVPNNGFKKDDNLGYADPTSTGTDKNLTEVFLFQNNPNPFDSKTEIKYYLPSSVNSVMILVSNLNGEQLASYKNLPVSKGTQAISIDGGLLSAGSYYYTLLVDGREVGTKKMILVK